MILPTLNFNNRKWNWIFEIAGECLKIYRGGEWSRKIVVKFHGSRSLDFLQSCSGVSILVSQSKNSKRLGLAEKNASLVVSQSLEFTIRHPYIKLYSKTVKRS